VTDNPAQSRPRGRQAPLTLYAVLAATIVFIPLVISPDLDVLYFFFVVPSLIILGLCVLIYAAFRKSLRIVVMVATFWTTSALLFIYPSEIRSPIKWLLWSSECKKQVLAQPVSPNGDFKHIEWDGWGWAGMSTVIYLVFDPTDSLAPATKSELPAKYNGLPCAVHRVRRLERHWYTAEFYTAEDWGGCSFAADKLRLQNLPPPTR
jgi:hypothetical protein